MATLSSPTLQSLISETRSFLNQKNPINSFWSDTELTDYLNEAVRLYFAEVTQMDEGQFTTSTDLDITNASETVALPSDCFVVKALYKKVQQRFEILPYRNNITEGYSTNGGTNSSSYLPDYQFQGNNLLLRPIPQFTEVAGLKIEYMQLPGTMVNGNDTLSAQVSPLFKNLIMAYAVWKAKLKQSMVNNVNVHSVAEDYLSTQLKSFRDTLTHRSKNPTYMIPFNP